MKPLITGQKNKIDNHHRGQATNFKGLHIHKTVFKKNFSVDILIPLEPSKEVIIRPKNRQKEGHKIYQNVVAEVKDALETNKAKREDFVKDLIKSIEGFSDNTNKIENLRSSAKVISGHFGLEEKYRNEIINTVEEKIKSFTTIHKEKVGDKLFYISQLENFIELGELMPNSTFYNLIYKK